MSLRKVFKKCFLLQRSAIVSTRRHNHDVQKDISSRDKTDDIAESYTSEEEIDNDLPTPRESFLQRVDDKAKEGILPEQLSFLNQNMDLSLAALRRDGLGKIYERKKEEQRFNSLRYDQLGPEIGAAHFIVGRNGGVKFKGKDNWVRKNESGIYILPGHKVPNLILEAIDASNTDLMYEGLENLEDISELRFLNLSNCQYIDDFCLSRLHMFKDTLEVLDLTGCQKVTENGITALHHLKNLRVLCIADTPNIKHKEILTLYIEEALENCVVRGVDHENIIEEDKDLPHEYTGYLERLNTNAMIQKLLQDNNQSAAELLIETMEKTKDSSKYLKDANIGSRTTDQHRKIETS